MNFLSAVTDKPRVTARNRLYSPFKKLLTTHKCTCKTHYHYPTSKEPDTFNEYREKDHFSDVDDGTIEGPRDPDDEDTVTESDWDEHATLVALLDDEEERPDFNDGEAVVDRLQPAFAAHFRAAKEQSKDMFIPGIAHVGGTHKRVAHDIYPLLLRGVVLFDKQSRALEDAARREQDQVVSTYARTTAALQELSFQLQCICSKSDKLSDEYEKGTDERVQQLTDCARSVPGDIERLISKVDKKYKSVTAEDHAKAKEKLLRGILDRY
ncbi:hypothetical protein AZE42_01628 [Rhizopogon vesiculosus]|uniref:Uncharacterized protein n=1 Tax=Rhizopogon vesiculosus TaxID=180088 RepID=A0A1J8QFQ3_9AGAM|nr:hypothetical protein AZE42_01628 [Rhizopogon vesiculosus]